MYSKVWGLRCMRFRVYKVCLVFCFGFIRLKQGLSGLGFRAAATTTTTTTTTMSQDISLLDGCQLEGWPSQNSGLGFRG